MSSIVGGKAIQLATSGQVTERPHARVFQVKGYVVVIGAYTGADMARDVCTCQAGQRGMRCSHAAAAHLQIASERQPA